MIIKTNDKWEAIHAVINIWLKDKRVYCNTCGLTYVPESGACCESPQLGTNWDICKALLKEIKMLKETRGNDYASIKGGNLRWGVSLPPDLLSTLDDFMKANGHKKGLFEKTSDLNKFMKKFPQFAIPKKV